MDNTPHINRRSQNDVKFSQPLPSEAARLTLLGSSPSMEMVSDQANRLRQLALPGNNHPCKPHGIHAPSNPANGLKHNPRVLLVSEFPVLHMGLSLAWELARQCSSLGNSTAIVDLAPAASRLPDYLRAINTPESQRALANHEPLWINASHGRGLAPWTKATADTVKLIAQPPGPFPSSEQMPRICEQFLRSIDGNSRQTRDDLPQWGTIILLSEVQGIPLDTSCWQAADEILLLLPQNMGQTSPAEAALAARLRIGSTMQRRLAIWKMARSSWNLWGPGTWNILRADSADSHSGRMNPSHLQLKGFENRRLDNFPSVTSPSQLRSLSRFAKTLLR